MAVLDASALLALVHGEPGANVVQPHVENAVVSSVNWAETQQRLVAHGFDAEENRADAEALGIAIVPFDADEADSAAALWPQTRGKGLSLGDRACLALARRLGATAMTADRSWAGLDIGVEVTLIR